MGFAGRQSQSHGEWRADSWLEWPTPATILLLSPGLCACTFTPDINLGLIRDCQLDVARHARFGMPLKTGISAKPDFVRVWGYTESIHYETWDLKKLAKMYTVKTLRERLIISVTQMARKHRGCALQGMGFSKIGTSHIEKPGRSMCNLRTTGNGISKIGTSHFEKYHSCDSACDFQNRPGCASREAWNKHVQFEKHAKICILQTYHPAISACFNSWTACRKILVRSLQVHLGHHPLPLPQCGPPLRHPPTSMSPGGASRARALVQPSLRLHRP